MSDVSKTNELITEAREAAVRSALWDIPHLLFRLADALEATTGVRVGMSSAVGVETQLAAARVPVQGERCNCAYPEGHASYCPLRQGEPNDDREALGYFIRGHYREHGMYSPDQGLADAILAAGFSRAVVPDANGVDAVLNRLDELNNNGISYEVYSELHDLVSVIEVPVPDAAAAAIDRLGAEATAMLWTVEGRSAPAFEGFADALGKRILAALDGAPEPEWEYRVECLVPGGSTHVTVPMTSFEDARAFVLENIHGGTVMGRPKHPASLWLPVEGESNA